MPKTRPSTALRRLLRKKIMARVGHLKRTEAAELLGFEAAMVSKLAGDENIFSLDRLVDAAARIGLAIRVDVK